MGYFDMRWERPGCAGMVPLCAWSVTEVLKPEMYCDSISEPTARPLAPLLVKGSQSAVAMRFVLLPGLTFMSLMRAWPRTVPLTRMLMLKYGTVAE